MKRTVRGYGAAGFAGVMIEDQEWPKRCGHVQGKSVVPRAEALARIRAAVVDAREKGAALFFSVALVAVRLDVGWDLEGATRFHIESSMKF